jgi:hypothetical protein
MKHSNTMMLLAAAEKPKSVVSIATRGDHLGYVLIRHKLSGAELAAFEEGAVFSRHNLTRLEELEVSHSLVSVVHSPSVTPEQRDEQLKGLAYGIASVLTKMRQTDVALSDQPVTLTDPAIALPGFPGLPEIPLLGYAPSFFE